MNRPTVTIRIILDTLLGGAAIPIAIMVLQLPIPERCLVGLYRRKKGPSKSIVIR